MLRSLGVAVAIGCCVLACGGDDDGGPGGGSGADAGGGEFGVCEPAATVTCDGDPGVITVDGVDTEVVTAFAEEGWIFLSTSAESTCGAYDFWPRWAELGVVAGDLAEVGCYDLDRYVYAEAAADFGGDRWFASDGPTAVWLDVLDGCAAGHFEVTGTGGEIVTGTFRAEICP